MRFCGSEALTNVSVPQNVFFSLDEIPLLIEEEPKSKVQDVLVYNLKRTAIGEYIRAFLALGTNNNRPVCGCN